jgi:CIC family chloride channel protein
MRRECFLPCCLLARELLLAEGPMVQLSAWLASWLARILPIPQDQRNAILICGIAAGISAAYHAPVAGVVFILELALGFFARNTIAPVLISAVTSSAIIFWMVEPKPLYIMPPVPLVPVTSLGLLVALGAGIASGLIGLWLLKFIEWGRTGFGYIGSVWLRFSIGGLIVGLLSVYVPEVWGNGYSVVSKVLDGGLAWKWVAIVLIAKFIATVASSSSGAIGGIFTPTLFMGATSGYLLGWGLEHWLGTVAGGDPVAMAIICMAAVLAAVTHAPLMAIVMVLEMTDQFHLVLPVMLACGAAYAVSTHFGVKPLYGNPIEHHA